MAEPAPDLRRVRGPHVFVDDLAAPVLSDRDFEHLSRSLRIRDGDPITISDGVGAWSTARFGSPVEPTGEVHTVDPARWPLTVAAALAKGAKPELIVQKLTELGIDRIVVFVGGRSVPRWDRTKRERSIERLDRIAREAAMQSRRVRLPTIDFADDLSQVIELVMPDERQADRSEGSRAARSGALVARADFGGSPIDATHRTVAIGPEGGWTDDERAMLPEAVDLAPSVLRAETAAIVAASIMVDRRSAAEMPKRQADQTR